MDPKIIQTLLQKNILLDNLKKRTNGFLDGLKFNRLEAKERERLTTQGNLSTPVEGTVKPNVSETTATPATETATAITENTQTAEGIVESNKTDKGSIESIIDAAADTVREGSKTFLENIKTYMGKPNVLSKTEITDLIEKYGTMVNVYDKQIETVIQQLSNVRTKKFFGTTSQDIFKKLWEKSLTTYLPSNYIKDVLFKNYLSSVEEAIRSIRKQDNTKSDAQALEELNKIVGGNKMLEPSSTAGTGSTVLGESGSEETGSETGGEKGQGSPQGFLGMSGVGLMAGFNVAYNVFGAFGAILVMATFFLSCIDILKFSVLEVWQYVMIFINPNMYNKDTLDFSTLYYHKNNEQDEPYTIYLQQELIALMFKLVQYFVYILIIPIGIHVFFSVLRGLGKSNYNDSIDLSSAKKSLGVMGITIASAFIQNTYYNVSFRRSLQPDMIASNEDILRMKDSLYDNMSTNTEFLESVVTENISDSIKIMNSQGTKYQAVEKMIFTLSLYNFFKMNLSTNAPEFGIIRRMFTLPEIRIREINPIDYMYFSQNVFLPNLYPMIAPYISGTGKVLETKGKQDIVRKGISNRLSLVNRLLMGLFTIPNRRSSFRNYIYLGWILSLAFVVGIYSIYSTEIDLIYEKFIVPFLKAINEFIWNIVFPVDTRSLTKKEKTEGGE